MKARDFSSGDEFSRKFDMGNEVGLAV